MYLDLTLTFSCQSNLLSTKIALQSVSNLGEFLKRSVENSI
jgi:hypothetical protein